MAPKLEKVKFLLTEQNWPDTGFSLDFLNSIDTIITAISIKLDYLMYFLLLNPIKQSFFTYDKPVLRYWRFAERSFV